MSGGNAAASETRKGSSRGPKKGSRRLLFRVSGRVGHRYGFGLTLEEAAEHAAHFFDVKDIKKLEVRIDGEWVSVGAALK